MNKIPVSVVIPVKNEAKNISRCLKLLEEFTEIMIVDSGSTDDTCAIAKSLGAKIITFNWNGQFPKKRNWVLRNIKLKNDWVLFLDADEFLTPEFKKELMQKIKENKNIGYWVRYHNFFMGKQLKHGDPFKKLPVFKVGAGEYEFIEEDSWSHLDMEVHEHPILHGKIGELKSPVIHRDYKGLEHYISKHNAYSSWEAKRYLKLKEKKFPGLNSRQRMKYRLMGMGLLPIFYFMGSYILKLGFLDGKEGLWFARYKANYFFQIQTKIEELKYT